MWLWNSVSALIFQVQQMKPKITAVQMAVLRFQLAGWAYQPPAGDQTCLGYLESARRG